MRLLSPPLIYRYIAREVATPFIISLFVFTGILFLARALKLVELVVNKNVPAGDILLLFSYIIPRFMEVAIPMAMLLGIIVAFGRLSHDSELVVLRAAGLSLKKLAIPVLGFASIAVVLALVITLWLRPIANHRLGLGLFEIAKTQASAGLVSGVFNELGQLTVYAESIEGQGQKLNNVIIGDRSNPDISRLFIAKYGKIVSDPSRRSLSLQLYDGSISEGNGLNFTVTYFQVNSIKIPHSALLGDAATQGGKGADEMMLGELLRAANGVSDTQNLEKNSLAKYQVELQKRFALPISCLCIALIAMALGIQPSRSGQTWSASTSVAMGIGLILFYYILFAVVTAIGEKGNIPAWLIMWLPNVLFAFLGYYLFERMGSEKWMAVSQTVAESFSSLFERIRLLAQGKHA